MNYAFRSTLGRRPDKAEQPLLEDLLKKQLGHYRQDGKAAEALVSQGPHAVPKELDPAELAAWASLANVLRNLDETTARE